MRLWFLIGVIALAACTPDEERRDRDPFVPSNNTTSNNTIVASNNSNNSNNNGTTTSNNGTASTNNTTGGGSYGEQPIALDADCEGISGLSGDVLLAAMGGDLVVNMADLDPDTSAHVNPRELTIGVTWPTAPVAVCYPEYDDGTSVIPPRLAVEGLTIAFSTLSGEFAESAEGAAWLSTNNGTVGSPSVVVAVPTGELRGTYQAGADVLFTNPLLSLFTTLTGAQGARGNIGMSPSDSIALSYGSFTARQIVAEWPYVP